MTVRRVLSVGQCMPDQAALTRTADQVTSGREKLRGLAHPAQELAPEEEPQPSEEEVLPQ